MLEGQNENFSLQKSFLNHNTLLFVEAIYSKKDEGGICSKLIIMTLILLGRVAPLSFEIVLFHTEEYIKMLRMMED